jgi:hypothetical protein
MSTSHTTTAMAAVVAILYMATGAGAQTVTLPLVNSGEWHASGVTNFHVSSNVVAQVINAFLPFNWGVSMRVSLDGAPATAPAEYRWSTSGTIPNLPIVVGPATISLSYSNTSALGQSVLTFVTIQLTSSYSFMPSSSVVIPNDGGGPITIILESSTDLINWTAANPGTYGTTTSNRFFRVRAQR